VVIGASKYKHLIDCEPASAKAPETYGLGQLEVSALTAWRVFEWLGKTYSIDGCPIAKCWLFLSPTSAEIAYEAGLTQANSAAHFADCKAGIEHWYATMESLSANAAAQSRAFFFFSGHGLEITQQNQVLLPADYLHGPLHNFNEAISTRNLQNALASIGVPKQFYFFDACRNDHQKLRAKRVRGIDILPEHEAASGNPALIAPVLYATSAGQQAFQHPKPADGLSIFGQALLDGLRGLPDLQLEVDGDECAVNMYPLEGFVKQQVVQALADARANVIQPVRFGGSSIGNERLTVLTREQAEVMRVSPTRSRFEDPLVAGVPNSLERASHVENLIAAGFSEFKLSDHANLANWSTEYQAGHKLFGSELVTELWSNRIKLYSFDTRQWLTPKDIDLNIVRRNKVGGYQVEFSLLSSSDPKHQEIGYWFIVNDFWNVRHACVLPGDREAHPIYQIDMHVETGSDHRLRIVRLGGSLSEKNQGNLGEAAKLWSKYESADIGLAIATYEESLLVNMVREKFESPLSAAVAAQVLLRANRLDLLHDWLRNLTNWVEARPDGPALWCEQMFRSYDKAAYEAHLVSFLSLLESRGLPQLSDAWSYAYSLLDRERRLQSEAATKLSHLIERFDQALPYFRPGGLFATYSEFDEDFPSLLIGV
jgi:hypothetical protein